MTLKETEVNGQSFSRDQLRHQQIHLLRHLSIILCQLCERIEWQALESADKRRLRRTLAALSSCINTVQNEVGTKARKPSRTTKATFRKR